MCRNRKKKTELLSPAGSLDILKAAADAGADAVYAAGNKFGARAYADNFTKQELFEALDYLHLRGKQLYLTVNTLLKEQEMRELYSYLAPLYEAGLDAVIVQDIGVLRFIRNYFPGLPIHASTQMTVTGAYGAKLLLEAGCSRIVTARELSLEEISHIYEETGAEIESFVHGALCYCYSGQCLMSSMLGGRSGNRGRCAQPCRLPYELLGDRKEASRKGKGGYLLSLKDLCTIELLPQIIQSGVYSLKIEGRMKQAEYAAGVTRIYRKYLDQYESDPARPYKVLEEDKELLLALGNRCGFTDGYYTRKNGKDMVTFLKPSHEKNKESLREHPRGKEGRIEGKEKIKGILRLFQGSPAQLMLQYKGIEAKAIGEMVCPALNQPLSRETVLEKMQKTGNTPFMFEELEVEMEENVFLTVGALNHLRRAGLQCLQEEILKGYRRNLGHLEGEAKNPSAARQAEGHGVELRVLADTVEQFQVALRQPETARLYLASSAFPRKALADQLKAQVNQAHEAGKKCYLALPYIFRRETALWFCKNWGEIEKAHPDGYLIRNYEEIQFLKEMKADAASVQGDYNLYGYSSEAARALEELSVFHVTFPVELNFKELKELNAPGGELIVYGRQPLMISSQCLGKNTSGCDHGNAVSYLKDRYGKRFPVKKQCEDCYNIIYNSSPTSLLHHMEKIYELCPEGIRLSFTKESPKEAEHVFECLRRALLASDCREKYFSDFTNGHFTRGVE